MSGKRLVHTVIGTINQAWLDADDEPEKRNPKSTTKRDVITKNRLEKAILIYKTTADLAAALGVSSGSIRRSLKKYGLILKEKGKPSTHVRSTEKTGSAKADLGKASMEADRVRGLIRQDKIARENRS